MALDLSRFAKAFIEEAQEHILALESLLISINLRSPDDEALNAIFRAVHSVKGGAAAFGHTALADFTHSFESILDRVRKKQLSLTKPMVDQFLLAGDLMRRHLLALDAEQPTDALAMQQMKTALLLVADFEQPAGSAPLKTGTQAIHIDPHFVIALALNRVDYVDPATLDALTVDLRGLGRVEVIETEAVSATQLEYRFRLFAREADTDAEELKESLEFLVPAQSIHIDYVDGDGIVPATTPEADSFLVAEPIVDDDPDGAYEFFAPLDPPPSVAAVTTSSTSAAFLDSDIALANIADASSIRVNVVKVDQIINLVGELVIAEAMLTQSSLAIPQEAQQHLSAGLAQLQRNTRDLQDAVLAIRMMPISFVFSRLPRLTRDLADRLNKEVDLELWGEDTELDKSVIEKIADPLTHLVRNAIDHGIEAPAERVARGKTPSGNLTVRASHTGGSVVISVSDDGAGLSREKILAKARELGLEGGESWADEEIWQLIFTPGFSTAAAVTDVSGRGVGMDVVWQNVHALGGKTDIASKTGVGTTITIRLPLTLAILDGMSIAVSGETYILPLSNVMQSLQPTAADLQTVSGQRVVMVRNEYVPIVSLVDLFNLPAGERQERPILVVLEVDGRHAALEVDELVGQHQVVLKSLESNYRRVAGVSGATILGDGRVALILDAAYLVSLSHAVRRDTRQAIYGR